MQDSQSIAQTSFSLFSSLSPANIALGVLIIAMGVAITRFAFYIQHNLLPASFLLPSQITNKADPSFGTTFYRWLGIFVALFGFLVLVGYIDIAGTAFGGRTPRNTRTNVVNNQVNFGGSIAD